MSQDGNARLEVVVPLLTALALTWAAIRWMFWPRAQLAIRLEVESVTKPFRDESAIAMQRLAEEIARLAAAIGRLEKHQEHTGTQVDMLIEDRRTGLSDRRRGRE